MNWYTLATLMTTTGVVTCVRSYLSAQILNVAFARSDFQCLLFSSLEVFLLAKVGHETNYLIAFFLWKESDKLTTLEIGRTHQ